MSFFNLKFWGLILLASLSIYGAEAGTVVSPFAEQFFRQRVEPVFVEHCYECHGNGRHKGGLSIASLAEFLAGSNEGVALIPGDVAKSPLIPAIRWEAHDEELNMPPKARLPDAAIADLTRWVEMGAPWPVATSSSVAVEIVNQPKIAKPPLIGRVHPLIVHFPIACLLLAVLAEALVVWRGQRWQPATALLLVIGALGAGVAVISGTWLAGEMTAAVQRHQLLGWITLIGSAVAVGLLFVPRRWPLRIAIIATAGAAGLTGHLGGDLVYGSGWLF